jgi:hypothetical protein
MRVPMTVRQLSQKLGMSRQNYYKSRLERQRRAVDSGLIEQCFCTTPNGRICPLIMKRLKKCIVRLHKILTSYFRT